MHDELQSFWPQVPPTLFLGLMLPTVFWFQKDIHDDHTPHIPTRPFVGRFGEPSYLRCWIESQPKNCLQSCLNPPTGCEIRYRFTVHLAPALVLTDPLRRCCSTLCAAAAAVMGMHDLVIRNRNSVLTLNYSQKTHPSEETQVPSHFF